MLQRSSTPPYEKISAWGRFSPARGESVGSDHYSGSHEIRQGLLETLHLRAGERIWGYGPT